MIRLKNEGVTAAPEETQTKKELSPIGDKQKSIKEEDLHSLHYLQDKYNTANCNKNNAAANTYSTLPFECMKVEDNNTPRLNKNRDQNLCEDNDLEKDETASKEMIIDAEQANFLSTNRRKILNLIENDDQVDTANDPDKAFIQEMKINMHKIQEKIEAQELMEDHSEEQHKKRVKTRLQMISRTEGSQSKSNSKTPKELRHYENAFTNLKTASPKQYGADKHKLQTIQTKNDYGINNSFQEEKEFSFDNKINHSKELKSDSKNLINADQEKPNIFQKKNPIKDLQMSKEKFSVEQLNDKEKVNNRNDNSKQLVKLKTLNKSGKEKNQASNNTGELQNTSGKKSIPISVKKISFERLPKSVYEHNNTAVESISCKLFY